MAMKKIEKKFDGFRVLVADDFEINQDLTHDMLELMGCEVFRASNGQEALDVCDAEDIELLFLDINMPEMDGYEVADIIRKKEAGSDKHLAIVAVTANALIGDKEKCLEAGMDDYISKPIKSASLESAITKFLAS